MFDTIALRWDTVPCHADLSSGEVLGPRQLADLALGSGVMPSVDTSSLGAWARAPTQGVRSFSSDDVDEVRSFMDRVCDPQARVVHGRGPYGFAFSVLDAGRVQHCWARTLLPHTIRGETELTLLQIDIDVCSRYRVGRRELVTQPGLGVLVPRGAEVARTTTGAGGRFAVAVDTALLRTELEARSGSKFHLAPRPWALRSSGPLWRALLDTLATSVRTPTGPQRRHVDAALVSRLGDVLLADAPARRGLGVGWQRAERLEQWIDAHLDEPLTLARLCSQADVGERALQKLFMARRGISPMRFVAERRYGEAYRRLRAADEHTTVARVARDLGFLHPGEFSAGYLRLVGELPSVTLRRGIRSQLRRGRSDLK